MKIYFSKTGKRNEGLATRIEIEASSVKIFLNLKRLIAKPKLFKFKGEKWNILLLVKNIPFIYTFPTRKQRDAAFTAAQQECAKCADVARQQTATIVCLEGARAMSSGLIEKRISSDSVASVTLQELLTALLTAKSSGIEEWPSLGKSTWDYGLPQYRRGLRAKVASLPTSSDSPVINRQMKKMEGKTIHVHKVKNGFAKNMYKSQEGGWYWKERWLRFTKPSLFATVINPARKKVTDGGKTDAFIGDMDSMIGKTIKVKESPYRHWYTGPLYSFHESWLDFDHITAKVKNVREGTWSESGGFSFTGPMKRFVGKKMKFVKTNSYYKMSDKYSGFSYSFDPDWLEL